MSDQVLSQPVTVSELEDLMKRQNVIKYQIAAEIEQVQINIHELTTEMANEVKDHSTLQVQSGEASFRDVESLQLAITDLGASHIQMQQLFASFSGNFSSILTDEQADIAKIKRTSTQCDSPTSASGSFSTPPAFSMAQELNREGRVDTISP
jgi:hypothetical protein